MSRRVNNGMRDRLVAHLQTHGKASLETLANSVNYTPWYVRVHLLALLRQGRVGYDFETWMWTKP